MIERLIARLRGAGLEPTALEVADALWLARQVGPGRYRHASDIRQEAPFDAAAGDACQTPSPEPSDQNDQRPQDRSPASPANPTLHPGSRNPCARGIRGIRTSVPGPSPLPHTRRLERAMRPLRLFAESRTDAELDPAATVEATAQALGSFTPVYARRREPWWDLLLVVDTAPSVALWRRSLALLLALCGRLRAFRRIHLVGIGLDQAGEHLRLQRLSSLGTWPAAADRTADLRDWPRLGPALCILASDCVSGYWYDGRLLDRLAPLAQRHSLHLLQLLPERRWRFTALAALPTLDLMLPRPDAPASDLKPLDHWLAPARDIEDPYLKLPVFAPTEPSLQAWSHAAIAAPGHALSGVLLLDTRIPDPAQDPQRAEAASDPGPPDAMARKLAFMASASDEAIRLAARLAAVPVTLPIARMVHQNAFGGAGSYGSIVEVLLSPLLVERERDGLDPEAWVFAFHDGVAELMLDEIPAAEAIGVIRDNSDYIRHAVGSRFDFDAVLRDPNNLIGQLALGEDQHFAECSLRVLRRLGGAYARLSIGTLQAIQAPLPDHEQETQSAQGVFEWFDDLWDSVVLITGRRNTLRFGTGFVVSADEFASWVVTCRHVVTACASDDELMVDGHEAELVASHPEIDLAVLKVPGLLDVHRLPLAGACEIGGCVTVPSWEMTGLAAKSPRALHAVLGQRLSQATGSDTTIKDRLEFRLDHSVERDSPALSFRGFSGAPIVCEANRSVIAILTGMMTIGNARFFGIAVKHLAQLWPAEAPPLSWANSADRNADAKELVAGVIPGAADNEPKAKEPTPDSVERPYLVDAAHRRAQHKEILEDALGKLAAQYSAAIEQSAVALNAAARSAALQQADAIQASMDDIEAKIDALRPESQVLKRESADLPINKTPDWEPNKVDGTSVAEPQNLDGSRVDRLRVPERFLVGFSFAGEQRELVRPIAQAVETRLGADTVFFDEWYEHYLAGADADLRLHQLYAERCDLVVVCVSERYGGKTWTQAEHEAIRARLMQARASDDPRDREAILPIRVGDGDVPGTNFNAIIVPDVRTRDPAATAELIVARLALISPDVSPAPPDPPFPNPDDQALSGALDAAYVELEQRELNGEDAADLRRHILELRRRIREGGRLRVGDLLLDGRYKLVERLKQGGFGTIYRAYDRQRRQLVAVKALHGQYADDRTRVERFFRGARKMADVAHRGIVRVLEPQLVDEGHYFFVMEYLPGGDLRDAVIQGALTPEQALDLIEAVAEALTYAHARGVVHRDVKPANIVLDDGLNPKLTDFDLAIAGDTTGGTRTGFLGTFVYAAPEAFTQAKEVDARADVYGLGMTAIFALFGQDPDFFEMVRDPQTVLSDLPVSEPLRTVLSRATALQSADRFESMDAFRSALKAARRAS